MPVVVLQHGGGHTTVSSGSRGPNSHLALSIFVLLCINPPFGESLTNTSSDDELRCRPLYKMRWLNAGQRLQTLLSVLPTHFVACTTISNPGEFP